MNAICMQQTNQTGFMSHNRCVWVHLIESVIGMAWHGKAMPSAPAPEAGAGAINRFHLIRVKVKLRCLDCLLLMRSRKLSGIYRKSFQSNMGIKLIDKQSGIKQTCY